MKKFLVLCGVIAVLIGLAVPQANAYQKDCLASLVTPTWLEGQSVPCSVRLDGGEAFHFLDQLGGEHIGTTEDEGYMRTSGGPVRAYPLMTGELTDTSSATTLLPVGSKTFFATIAGTGAQSVTVTIYGDYKSTATEEFLLCTLSLTGTTEDAKKCDAISEDYKFYHAKTASISGTGATVNVWAEMGIGGAAGGGGGGGAVTNAGTFAVQVTSEAATGVEDAAETAGGALKMVGSVRRDVAASSAGATGDNATLNTSGLGLLWTRNMDPCSGIAKVFVPISISSATTTELINGAGASTRVYICSLVLHTDAANDVAVVEDDTDACASPTGGLFGGATSGTGFQLTAGSGAVIGNGQGTMAKTSVDNYYVCIITSAATQLTGTLGYALAP